MMKNKKAAGALVALAYVLNGAADKFTDPAVSTYKMRRQAERVMRNCAKAIGSVGGSVSVDKGDHREVNDALKRQAQRTLDEFVGAATVHMQRRQMYCREFVCARIMGCHLAIDHMARKYGAPKEWRKLEQVTATMLSMLLVDLGDEEALMYRVAESFEGRIAA